MIKIAFTGPECSGKSTLCKLIADEFKCEWIPEYAREYLQNKSEYYINDLDIMAQEQFNKWQTIKDQSLVICDTELLVYKIWSKVKFGKTSTLINQLYSSQVFDHYFLCKPDIPWEFDSLRENPENRADLFEMYLKELEIKNCSFSVLTGNLEKRLSVAKKTIITRFRIEL
jgi:nicotinamide riboside kinase